LPYVYQGAVEHCHWLTPTQMIDALALGETTPEPLIMVVTFVGFVGGLGEPSIWCRLTICIGFYCSPYSYFLYLLAEFYIYFSGWSFIETTHGNLKFTAALSAITPL